MARKPKSKPSFFKVLIGNFTRRLVISLYLFACASFSAFGGDLWGAMEAAVYKIRLPSLFVLNYGEILPENVTLKTDSGGSWNVKLKQDDGQYHFTQGWFKFVEDLDLKLGTFLVFRLVGNSTISVSVYGLSGCDLELEDGENQTDDSEPEEVPLRRPARNHAKGKQPDYMTVKKERLSSVESANPQFRVVLKKHHRYRLTLYKEFATETGLDSKKATVLEDQQGRYWPVTLVWANIKWFKFEMTTGWSEFRKANRLAFGDSCLFEFIPSKNVIRVTVIKPES